MNYTVESDDSHEFGTFDLHIQEGSAMIKKAKETPCSIQKKGISKPQKEIFFQKKN